MGMYCAYYKGTKRFFNKAIVWKTGGPYSHCEALFDFDLNNRIQHCASASDQDNGVRFKDIALAPARWDIIYVPEINEEAAFQWFIDHDGEPYDYRGLLNFIIPVGHNPAGWFCPEALGTATGIPHPHRFDPTDLACVMQAMNGVWLPNPTGVALYPGVQPGFIDVIK